MQRTKFFLFIFIFCLSEQAQSLVSLNKALYQNFTKSELRFIDQTLKSLPPRFKNLKGFGGFVRLKENAYILGHEGYAATASSATLNSRAEIIEDGYITLTTLFFSQSKASAKLSLVHEICHQLDYQPLYEGKEPYSQDKKGEFYHLSKKSNGYVTFYAKDGGSYEDFAESCAYFILDKERLRFRSPKKFRYFEGMLSILQPSKI